MLLPIEMQQQSGLWEQGLLALSWGHFRELRWAILHSGHFVIPGCLPGVTAPAATKLFSSPGHDTYSCAPPVLPRAPPMLFRLAGQCSHAGV